MFSFFFPETKLDQPQTCFSRLNPTNVDIQMK